MNISWTPTARDSYFEILAYLEESWSEKEIELIAFWDTRQDPSKISY